MKRLSVDADEYDDEERKKEEESNDTHTHELYGSHGHEFQARTSARS